MFRQDRSIAYLDGIRGVAALGVFLNHFSLAFYSAWFTGKPETSHLKGYELEFSHSYISFINNGSFWVSIFFVLSGYVLSHKYFLSNNVELLVSGLHRRFLRLFVPIAFALTVSYILLTCNLYYHDAVSRISLSDWFYNLWRMPNPTLRYWQSLTYGTMFLGVASLDTCLWTMPYEFYGSLFVFAFLLFTHFTRRYRLLMMGLAMYYFFMLQSPVYMDFVLGMTLFYIEQQAKKWRSSIKNVVALLLLPIGLLLGSSPFCSPAPGTWQETIKTAIWDYTAWCPGIAGYCLILAFVLSPAMQKVANLRVFAFLGFISFSFYLLHPLALGSFGSWIFLQKYDGSNYNYSALISFIATLLVLIPASWLMARYVDQFGIRFAKRVYERVRGPKPETSAPVTEPN